MKLSKYDETWCRAVSKMPCGRQYEIPFYGTVRAYRSKSGRRMFALSKTCGIWPSGNLSLRTVVSDIAFRI